MAIRKTSHEVVVRVKFDKPCTSAFAVAAVRDCVHGDFFPPARIDLSPTPEVFAVKGVTRLPKRYKSQLT